MVSVTLNTRVNRIYSVKKTTKAYRPGPVADAGSVTLLLKMPERYVPPLRRNDSDGFQAALPDITSLSGM